jgi:hypothetical protein
MRYNCDFYKLYYEHCERIFSNPVLQTSCDTDSGGKSFHMTGIVYILKSVRSVKDNPHIRTPETVKQVAYKTYGWPLGSLPE